MDGALVLRVSVLAGTPTPSALDCFIHGGGRDLARLLRGVVCYGFVRCNLRGGAQLLFSLLSLFHTVLSGVLWAMNEFRNFKLIQT